MDVTVKLQIKPGQSVLELTNITFSEDPDALAEFRKYRQSMDAIHTRVDLELEIFIE